MITFKDLQIETKEYDFFVPFGLKAIIGLQLKENNIPFTTTSWREVDRTKHAAESKMPKHSLKTINVHGIPR